jgi:hypothetical protein
MNTFSSHFSRLATGSVCAIALAGFLYHSEAAYAGETQNPNAGALSADFDFQLRFKDSQPIGAAEQSSVAVHSSGLVVSVFKGRNPDGSLGPIQYRIGKMHGSNVTWGNIQYTAAQGYWPAVTISKEGYVIIVYSTENPRPPRGKISDVDLLYQVGWIDPNGDANQVISMRTGLLPWDAGHNVGIAMNAKGVIVAVHEAGRGGDGIYYRVGHLRNPAGNDYTVEWDSGQWGIKYDVGVNPRIGINNHDQVVSVHQVPGENMLHYRRGVVSGGTIQFSESRRYDNYAIDPSVALLDSGLVLEVHGSGDVTWYGQRKLMSRAGTLSLSNPAEIEWADPYDNPIAEWDSPAIATNGTYAVETHTFLRENESGQEELTTDYSVAKIFQQYANGTLVRGSSGKVYAILTDYRHWIPDATTFDAIGYKWKEILPLSDYELNALPEGTPFPSVAPQSGPLTYLNGTLVKGSSEKVYVVLNDHRYWIPDETTFDALAYQWENILWLSDDVVNALPEGAPFPSVECRASSQLPVSVEAVCR